ncbi:hypothetical protein [Frankia sp. CcI49]|uniref:hypothetical protein n=1 Tax=Frankia sp. CcI49 TaxID=1745382 RepID=UPI00130432CC|nr:hypothetical protein [Frankia sp. CcI49]
MSTTEDFPDLGGDRKPHPGPVVAVIKSLRDLPVVLVAGVHAERFRTDLLLVHLSPPSVASWLIPDGLVVPITPPQMLSALREDPGLRDRAVTLASLSGVPLRWLELTGQSTSLLARVCRQNRAPLIVLGTDADHRPAARWRVARRRSRDRHLEETLGTSVERVIVSD